MKPSAPHPCDDDISLVAIDGGPAERASLATPEAVRWLALGAVGGPLVLVLAWLIFGLLRPGYSPIRQPISDLGIGAHALGMNGAFVLSGLLLLAGVGGISERLRAEVGATACWIGAGLLALSPVGLVVIGIYTEALSTVIGHLVGVLLAFPTPPVGFLVMGLFLRHSAAWRRLGRWLLVASPLTLLVVVVVFQVALPGGTLTGIGVSGLIERVALVEMHAWYVLLGWWAFRQT